MSRFAHVMCEACCRKSKIIYDEDFDLTDAHEGRRCCWCENVVEFSLVVHRHPDEVPCKGKHEGT